MKVDELRVGTYEFPLEEPESDGTLTWDSTTMVLVEARADGHTGVRDEVPVYGSGGFTSLPDERLERQLLGWVRDQGIPRVKIKIGEDWGRRERRDLERVRFARGVVGDGIELYVDANGGYTRKQA